MIKKLYLMMFAFMLLFSTTYASENATFFGGDPVVNSWDANLGTGTLDFGVDTTNSNTIQADVQLIWNGGVVHSQQFTGLGARDSVQYTIDIPLNSPPNKNGDYTFYVELRNEADMNEFDFDSFREGPIGTYTGGNPLEEVYYLYGSPSPTALDQNAGTFSFDWYTGTDTGLTDMVTTTELIHDVAGIIDSQTFPGLSHNSYNEVSYDITTLGNYNGIYTVRVYTESAGNVALNNEVILNVYDYQNGVVYSAPSTPSGDTLTDTTGQLPQVGSNIGSFLSNMAPGVVAFIFILSIIGGIVGLFAAVVTVIKNSLKKGKK